MHMPNILQTFLNLATCYKEFIYLHAFIFFFLTEPHGMQDFSSLIRNETCTPCIGRLNHCTTREVLGIYFQIRLLLLLLF